MHVVRSRFARCRRITCLGRIYGMPAITLRLVFIAIVSYLLDIRCRVRRRLMLV
jgi:hypothetical protein